MATENTVLALTDDVVLRTHEILLLTKVLGNDKFDDCQPQIITQATSLGQLPLESSSVQVVVAICHSFEFPDDQLYGEISRVLKPGGDLVIQRFSHPDEDELVKLSSSLVRKLLLVGFLEAQVIQRKLPTVVPHIVVKATKPSWKVGSSFALRKTPKVLSKVQLDDEDDLIDEDSLLSEEDLRKPPLPLVDDCEVGSTRKACKNCVCGRAESEAAVEKLGLSADQLDNPQSACGNVCFSFF
ncbi:hypothetical protein SAY86_020779 [Trapa natans]|uniref:Anamorsin N-terminal domain-containing protein n=1 Tax=Trapa natans TaxID=22666 RepID=A0AAN7M8N6_TRANT|nr:hypothetical protein SAY86_020779 [Trapa natans]